MRVPTICLFLASSLFAAGESLIPDVRGAISRGDFAQGESEIAAYRVAHGVTPEMLEALSWLGRGALAAKNYDKAEAYAAETRKLSLEQLKRRPLDAEAHLPIALGASMEVQAHTMSALGRRAEAVGFLRQELATYRNTSIRTRIQKNIHLLSLEGQPAPALEIEKWLGPKPQPLAELKGRPVLLFFWAHWCPDCKRQSPDLARLLSEFGAKGLTIVAPTQLYGYMARGQDATPEQEMRYIGEVRKQYYSGLEASPAPVSEENFKNYGASTTPTLVLIDKAGLVRMYHPGNVAYADLAAQVRALE